jgi:prepilin-type processing-associated H-X9-DG protein
MARCPLASKPDDSSGLIRQGAKFVTWEQRRWPTKYFHYGSYGMNEFLLSSPPGATTMWGHSISLNWGQANVKGAANIPLFLDCAWVGGSPASTDEPPQFDDEPWQWGYVDNMKRFCINRHDGYINGVFLDSSVRKIGLKELWKLNWHRGYDLNANPPAWPSWMRGFKNY